MNSELDCSFGCRGNQDRVGVLIAQLGTPDAPTPSALKKYLSQFLWDPRVIEVNRPLWWCILNGFILNTRPKRSAKLYERIWTENGSPLLTFTASLTEKLTKQLHSDGRNVEVAFGMRYGSPSIELAIDSLIKKGCSKILLFPMYPQYAAATTASTYDAVFKHLLKRRWVPTLRVAEPFCRNTVYLNSLANSINSHLQSYPAGKEPERLVFSYHGIPEKYVEKGDPYCCMCTESTEALKPYLKIDASKIVHTYQSKFGRDPWLVPYTDVTLGGLAREGVKRIAVVCPGFTTDCLETIDEMGHEGSKLFKSLGGEELTLIPCLNDQQHWIEALSKIVVSELGTWVSNSACNSKVACPISIAKSKGIKP